MTLGFLGVYIEKAAMGISNQVQPLVIEASPSDERIMRWRVKHTLDVMSLAAEYAPTEMCVTEEEMLYAQLDSVIDPYPPWDTLIVSGDFDATTSDSWTWVTCWSPWFWYQEHYQLSTPELCKIQEVTNYIFLLPETRTAMLDVVYECWSGSKGSWTYF